MSSAFELVAKWREMGPIEWAQGPHGWIGEDGKPIRLTDWQRAVLAAWWLHYATVTTLAISNVKKTGKTFLNACLLAYRWLSLPGVHFAIGNDLDQSAGRQYQMISDMVKRNPFLKTHCKVTDKKLTFLPTGSTIEALAVDAAGNAGANHLTASHTEAWGIIYEAGIRAYEELTPPPGKAWGFPAMRIADSYAGIEGDSKTWHNLVDRGLKGERVSDDWPIFRNGGLLLFHMESEEAQRRCFRGTPEEADTYYTEQRADLRTGAFLRLHENKRTSGTESFILLEWWDACTAYGIGPLGPSGPQTLYVGADASTKKDSAAVVAVFFDAELKRPCLAKHRIWQPSKREPLDIDGTIGQFLRELRKGYHIAVCNYDPFQLHDLATRLNGENIPMREYAQSVPNLTVMGQRLFDLIKSAGLAAYKDADLRRQIGQAVAIETPRGWRIAKEKSSHKIDAVVALAMACVDVPNDAGFDYSKANPHALQQTSKWHIGGITTYTGYGSRWSGVRTGSRFHN